MAKTLKLKAPDPTIAAKPAAPADAGAAQGGSDGIYVASRHRNPMEGSGPVRRQNWTWAAILAVASTLLVLVALIVEYMDWSTLRFA